VYSDPIEFDIGPVNTFYGFHLYKPFIHWKETLNKHNISNIIIEKLESFFEENHAQYKRKRLENEAFEKAMRINK